MKLLEELRHPVAWIVLALILRILFASSITLTVGTVTLVLK